MKEEQTMIDKIQIIILAILYVGIPLGYLWRMLQGH